LKLRVGGEDGDGFADGLKRRGELDGRCGDVGLAVPDIERGGAGAGELDCEGVHLVGGQRQGVRDPVGVADGGCYLPLEGGLTGVGDGGE